MIIDSFTIPGPKGSNQDCALYGIEAANAIIFGVADGVGGSAGGGKAAEFATSTVENIFGADPEVSLEDLFLNVSQKMTESADPIEGSTTLSIVRVKDYFAEVGHTGDSRVFHLRGNGILTRTRDHTEIAELVRQGVFSKSEARRYPRKNVLLSAMSSAGDHQFYSERFAIESGDLIIACTDGLYNVLTKREIRDVCRDNNEPAKIAKILKEMVLERGIVDDTTAVIALC